MLQALGELINLAPAIRQLRGHIIERAHKRAELVLRLSLHAIGKIAARDLAGALGQRLDRHGDLLR